MQFREQTDCVSLSRSLHEFVSEKVNNKELPSSLQDERYYVMVYSCASTDSIDILSLPAGTIVVPYESLSRLFLPFGLNELIKEEERKSKV